MIQLVGLASALWWYYQFLKIAHVFLMYTLLFTSRFLLTTIDRELVSILCCTTIIVHCWCQWYWRLLMICSCAGVHKHCTFVTFLLACCFYSSIQWQEMLVTTFVLAGWLVFDVEICSGFFIKWRESRLAVWHFNKLWFSIFHSILQRIGWNKPEPCS